MKVIALEAGYYRGRRIRAGEEFEFEPRKSDGKHPSWTALATPEAHAKFAADVRAKDKKAFDALVAAAGPKRVGTTGVRRVNTGLADASPEPGKPKAVTRWPVTKNEADVAGVDPVQPAGFSDLA
jgi:hypothetical protein